jgi:hypothetical protein
MGTTSRSNKANEWAAKINHTQIINDPFIKQFLQECEFPKEASDIEIKGKGISHSLDEKIHNPIKHILAVDGGYTTVEVKKNLPSAQIAFFQFGAVLFNVSDLEPLSEKPFIFPEDMNKLHDLERFKLAIPVKNIIYGKQTSLTDSIRKAIYDFFMTKHDSSCLMETLCWLVFEEYNNPVNSYSLGSSPYSNSEINKITLMRSDMNSDYTFDTEVGKIFITDIFRLHEAIDEEFGAGGILSYITCLIEQLILVHYIKTIRKHQPSLLHNFLFIADGPLSFSGQTANMHKPVRKLCNFLLKNENLFLVGLEKSGPFVDHAQEICIPHEGKRILQEGNYIILDNKYIYKYIIPGDPKAAYAKTSYYGGKVIFHSSDDQIFILTVPVPHENVVMNPQEKDYKNLKEIMINIQKLRCNMYDDSIIPIALANKLVSLANHPSKVILEKFARNSVGKT